MLLYLGTVLLLFFLYLMIEYASSTVMFNIIYSIFFKLLFNFNSMIKVINNDDILTFFSIHR